MSESAYGDWDVYDDTDDRQAFMDLFENDGDLISYVKKQFGLDPDAKIFLSTPESKFDVDFHVHMAEGDRMVLVGLIEVDHLNDWRETYPYNYDYIHHTKRKMRYINEERYTEFPYLHFTFSKTLDKCYSYNRQAVSSARGPIQKRFRKGPDTVWEVPRERLKLWGDWPTSEKLKFYGELW